MISEVFNAPVGDGLVYDVLNRLLFVGLAAASFSFAFGLLFGTLVGLVGGLTTDQVLTRASPNEGIRRSFRNALVSLLIGQLFFGLLVGLPHGLPDGLRYGLLFGTFAGLLVALRKGGFAVIQHYVLRVLLWRNCYAPLNYVQFLDHAAERVFLRKVGGGYIFTHRLLMEYFATLQPTDEARQTKTS